MASLVKHCSVGSSSPRIANNFLPFFFFLPPAPKVQGKKIAPRRTRLILYIYQSIPNKFQYNNPNVSCILASSAKTSSSGRVSRSLISNCRLSLLRVQKFISCGHPYIFMELEAHCILIRLNKISKEYMDGHR